MLPRRFALVRHVDYTGVSGVGVVAYGVAFIDGHVILRWSSEHPSTSTWNSIDDLMAVHGHGDATSIEWLDAPHGEAEELSISARTGRRARRRADRHAPETGSVAPLRESKTGHPTPFNAPASAASARVAPGAPPSPRTSGPRQPDATTTGALPGQHESPPTAAPSARPAGPAGPAGSPASHPAPSAQPAPAQTAPTQAAAAKPTSAQAPPQPTSTAPRHPSTPSPYWPESARGRNASPGDEPELTQEFSAFTERTNDTSATRRPDREGTTPPSPARHGDESDQRSDHLTADTDSMDLSSERDVASHGATGADLGELDDQSEETTQPEQHLDPFFTNPHKSNGHPHVDTITGLLDLPDDIYPRRESRAAEADSAPRPGRHRRDDD